MNSDSSSLLELTSYMADEVLIMEIFDNPDRGRQKEQSNLYCANELIAIGAK